MVGEECPDKSTSGAPRESALGRHLRSGRVFIAGIIAAALTAVLTQVMTGWMGDAWRYLLGQHEPAPIAIAVQSYQDDVCYQDWMIPLPLKGLPSPPRSTDPSTGAEDWSRWAEHVNGVPAASKVLLSVQGRTDTEVTIANIRFKAVKRAPVFAGTHVYTICGAGAGPIRWLRVTLDKERPPQVTAKFDESNPELKGGAPAWERQPIRFPYKLTVSKSEAETFLIDAYTDNCDCSWTGQVEWTSLDRTGSLPFDYKGAPFRITSTSLADHECSWVVMGSTTPWK